MKSDLHKVLHPIARWPMLLHLMDGFAALSPAATVVVVGDKREQVEAALAGTGAVVAVQEPQLGTAHAALQAKAALAGFDGIVLVCFGDCPMLTPDPVRRLCGALESGARVAVLGFRPAPAAASGRIFAATAGTVRQLSETQDAPEP